MAFITWDAAFEAAPDGSADDASTVDQSIQELKQAIRERMDTCFNFSLVGSPSEDGSLKNGVIQPQHIKGSRFPLLSANSGLAEAASEFTFYVVFESGLEGNYLHMFVQSSGTGQIRLVDELSNVVAGPKSVSGGYDWSELVSGTALVAGMCDGVPKSLTLEIVSGTPTMRYPMLFFGETS